MRVIAGSCRGRRLYRPQTNEIRPTADKVKKYIFDYIGDLVSNAVVLDLFSGTGNLAIEALSRGARFAVLVDISKTAIALIYRNLKLTNLLGRCRVVRQDSLRFLRISLQKGDEFDLIFADPPYFDQSYHEMIAWIDREKLLKNGGFFILEHSARVKIEAGPASLILKQTRQFGDTAITIYQKRGQSSCESEFIQGPLIP